MLSGTYTTLGLPPVPNYFRADHNKQRLAMVEAEYDADDNNGNNNNDNNNL